MRVLVCGDREWTDILPIALRLVQLPEDAVIVHGDCRGADRLAGNEADLIGLTVESYPADWKRYGRGAGPIRNQQMLDSGIDLVIAFHPDPNNSKGTKNMLNMAGRAGIEIEIYNG
jgi:hypothetical protein